MVREGPRQDHRPVVHGVRPSRQRAAEAEDMHLGCYGVGVVWCVLGPESARGKQKDRVANGSRTKIEPSVSRTIFCTAAVQPDPVKRTTSSAALPVTRAFTDSTRTVRCGVRGRSVVEYFTVSQDTEAHAQGGVIPTCDDLPRLVAVQRGLHARDGGGGVRVPVEGHHLHAQEILFVLLCVCALVDWWLGRGVRA